MTPTMPQFYLQTWSIFFIKTTYIYI